MQINLDHLNQEQTNNLLDLCGAVGYKNFKSWVMFNNLSWVVTIEPAISITDIKGGYDGDNNFPKDTE